MVKGMHVVQQLQDKYHEEIKQLSLESDVSSPIAH